VFESEGQLRLVDMRSPFVILVQGQFLGNEEPIFAPVIAEREVFDIGQTKIKGTCVFQTKRI
jgi:hypothetical protein